MEIKKWKKEKIIPLVEKSSLSFSEKVCYSTETISKKIKKLIKWSIFYLEVSLTIANGISPSHAIGLPVFPLMVSQLRSTELTSQKLKVTSTRDNVEVKINYTPVEVDELQQLIFKQFEKELDIDQVITRLRAGGLDLDYKVLRNLLLLALTAYLLRNFPLEVEGFLPVHHNYPPVWGNNNNGHPPHVGGYGKGIGPKTLNARTTTRLEATRKWIQHAYSQIPNVHVEGTNWEITPWSVAKHAHHGPDFGIDPVKYGMTHSDLKNIAKKGLINHVNQGGTPPSPEYVQAMQNAWHDFAKSENVRDCGTQSVMGRDCQVLKQDSTRIFLSFDSKSGESYTGYQLTLLQSTIHNEYGTIGQNYKN